jgi:predicted metal-dependent phosphoesterase TrpH
MPRGDLHIHTDRSDGVLSPAEVARQAAAEGLGFFSVTDHNCLTGIGLAEEALGGGGPELIRGVELSAQPDESDEVHVLGYGFDPACPALRDLCSEVRRLKREQFREIVRRLRGAGVDVDQAGLGEAVKGSYTGRPVLARMLLDSGVVQTIGQAFAQYLGSAGSAFVPMQRVSPRRCIETIHEAGGLAVLAHPRIATIDMWVEDLTGMGLDGLELYRPALRGNEQLYVEKAAEHFELFVTGGSDWHGRDGEDPLASFAVDREHLSDFFHALESLIR